MLRLTEQQLHTLSTNNYNKQQGITYLEKTFKPAW